MKRLHLIVCFFCFSVLPLAAQQHLSVPLDDPVYRVIENAVIKNYIPAHPTAKPYSRATVLSALREMIESPHILPLEKRAAEGMIARFESHKTEPWYQRGGYRYDSENAVSDASEAADSEESLSDTDAEKPDVTDAPVSDETTPLPTASAGKNEKPVYTTVEIGGSWQTDVDFGAFNKDGVFSTENWLDLYLQGDLSEYFSYRFNLGVGLTDLDASAYSPYSYSKSWDGYQFLLKSADHFSHFAEEPAGTIRILPEFSLALWDQKLKFNFSRIRRDWGPGDGNLMISGTARPFMGLDMHLNPVDWFNLSFIVGVLEYESTDGLKKSSSVFQNAYTASLAEFFITEWAYLGISSSVIWPKRFELGYGHPGMMSFLYQNMIGDFDNMQLGVTLGFNVPNYLKLYGGIFIDEVNVLVDNFAHLDRNMYSWQLGGRLAVPGAPFTTVSFQYTKVEPYMYTHPKTDIPWYDKPMDTTYINHGEPLGYKLDPNSDELKLKVETMPLWYLNASLMYRMIRHGISADGSTYTDALNYSSDYNGAKPGDLYWKDFLKDGVYEWIHSVGLEAELDLRFVNVPIALGAGYTFYYRYLTEYDSANKKLKRLGSFEWNDSVHQTNTGNLFSIYIRVW